MLVHVAVRGAGPLALLYTATPCPPPQQVGTLALIGQSVKLRRLLETCQVSGLVLGSLWGLAVHRKTRARTST